jgi:DUF2934 family protein
MEVPRTPRAPRAQRTTTPKPATATPRPRRRTAKSTTPDAAVSTPATVTPTYDEIARRAYEISLERNGGPGDALSDWLQAERELAPASA